MAASHGEGRIDVEPNRNIVSIWKSKLVKVTEHHPASLVTTMLFGAA